MQFLKDNMEKEMLAKMKESEDLYNMKLREMEAGQQKMQVEMEAKLLQAENKRKITDKFHTSLKVGRLQRAEEKRKGKRAKVILYCQ